MRTSSRHAWHHRARCVRNGSAGGVRVLDALAELTDADLARTVTIRGVELTVVRALERSLSHTSYHVGQMTFLGKMLRGPDWSYLSIPPGGTEAYNRDPRYEKGFDVER